MSHKHWVARQNKLEIPRDKDEVNKREIHECDGWTHDLGTMVVPLTLKSTHKTQALVREPPTIVSRREEDAVLRKWTLPRYCWARFILETKTKVGSTTVKTPVPRTHPNIDEAPTSPKSHTHPSHEYVRWSRDPEAVATPQTPKPTRKTKVGNTGGKVPVLRTNPRIGESPTEPKPPTHPSHPRKPPVHQPRLHP